MGRRVALVAAAVLVVAGVGAGGARAQSGPTVPAGPEFVLSPEGNCLWAYDASTLAGRVVIHGQNASCAVPEPAASGPSGPGVRRDINGQVCVSPDQTHVVTGEDTVVPPVGGGGGGDGGSSHDPRIAGWGYFSITGSSLDAIQLEQVGKLAPEAGEGPRYTGDPDNYGCGFLDADRLFTTAIGNTLPGEPANGQLFLWFGPFTDGFRSETTEDGTGFFVGEVDHCQIDDTLATAGGIAVDGDGNVYVATNRPTAIPGGDPAAVWRFRPPTGGWPTSAAACVDGLVTGVTKELVLPALPGLPADVRAPTPSAVVLSPAGTLYVSSVFAGTVAEYRTDGTWVRDLYPLSPVTPATGPTTQTPFGLALLGDGSLWIADLGIAVAAPAPGEGSVIRLPFAGGSPQVLDAATVQDGLTFPDGLGVYAPPATEVPGMPEAGPTETPVASGARGGGNVLARTGPMWSPALASMLALVVAATLNRVIARSLSSRPCPPRPAGPERRRPRRGRLDPGA